MPRLSRPTASQRARNQLLRIRANRENIEYAEMEMVENVEAHRRRRENFFSQGCRAGR